jgi:hypothetical protein
LGKLEGLGASNEPFSISDHNYVIRTHNCRTLGSRTQLIVMHNEMGWLKDSFRSSRIMIWAPKRK